MKKSTLLLGCFLLMACSGPEPAPAPEVPREYVAPDWSRDETIAMINSKISLENQKVLLTTMRATINRDIVLFSERVRQLRDLVAFEERRLNDIIADYPPEPGIAPTPENEEDFISFCASLKIQIELLKLQQFHEEDLNRLELSMNRLAASLPEEH